MICLILCVAHHTRFFLLLLLTNLFNELFFVFDNSIKEKREKKVCFIMSTYCISYSFAFPTLHFYFIWLYYTFWRVFYSTANQPVGIITRRDEKKLRKNLVLGTLVIFLLLFFLNPRWGAADYIFSFLTHRLKSLHTHLHTACNKM